MALGGDAGPSATLGGTPPLTTHFSATRRRDAKRVQLRLPCHPVTLSTRNTRIRANG